MSSDDSLSFGDLVKKEFIIDGLEAATREEALTQMADLLVSKGFCKPSFTEAILQREAKHPSGLPMPGHKIAIPHTDAEHVIQSVILFARLARPVIFQSMGDPNEKLPTQMISMFALKEKKRIGDMLETLIGVYQDNKKLSSILDAKDSLEIYSILRTAVQEQEKA